MTLFSPNLAYESLVQKLSAYPATTHAILNIDLKSIGQNYQKLVSFAKPTRIAAVLKADAYGLGATQVSETLAQHGCEDFFVAYLDEGINIRTHLESLGYNPNIYILNGLLPNTEKEFFYYNLTPILADLDHIEQWQGYAKRVSHTLNCGFQVDTGLWRYGLSSTDLHSLHGHSFEGFSTQLIMSHLACADDKEHPANQEQLNEFQNIRSLLPVAPASLAASHGLFIAPNYLFQMARVGLALYGPFHNSWPLSLKNCVSIWARALKVQEVPKGRGIGYGHTFMTQRPTKVLTLALGYADGYLRSLGNKSFVAINGYPAPVIGRISMDLITVDITDVPGPCQVGDWIEIMGNSVNPYTIYQSLGGNVREGLLYLGSRLKRVYDSSL